MDFVVDGLKLSGVLHLPERPPLAVIVGCHGLMANKNSPKQIELARGCLANGMAYFRFDHRGCGQSDGVFEKDTTLENRTSDLTAAVHAVEGLMGKKMPVGLFGSSLGGTVCLTAASGLSPFAIVTLAAPVESRSIRMPEESPESLKNEIGGKRMTFNIGGLMTAIHHILVVHGSSDETVSVENARTIYRMAGEPRKKLILNDGDHRISNRTHQEIFIQAALKWFVDCCPPPAK
ncbi:acetyltransferase [Desulfosarcina alkanivorans]|uniref:Acetyltransferase n=1 Tax=Desulfosarcina alkanivorans TaxID=571177 RepID=A0A5K7YKB2_9BACT|nr:alpha/beta fold hydrolase [Desulfosarcina alkanivorans]BBO67231.1 acetyltransferase [Desulfosarcina alkanivorans]